MKRRIKRTLRRWWPSLFFAITSYRFFLYCRKRFKAFQTEFREEVYKDSEVQVLSGPFTGMNYYDRIVWGPITPKWIGSYEREIHGVIDKIVGVGYSKIIDIGAAEGYYAVGLAYRSPNTRVISYEIDPIGRIRQRQLATLNGIRNLEIRKQCTHSELTSQLGERCVVICDIEGFEVALMDPSQCPELAVCDLLVEVHRFGDFDVPEVRHY